MAITIYKCDPRTTFGETGWSVSPSGTAIAAVTKAPEAPAGKPELTPRLVSATNGNKFIPLFGAPAGLKAALEAGGKVVGAKLWVYGENRAAAGKNLKAFFSEPSLGVATAEPELAKNVPGWILELKVSKAEAEANLNTISKIELQKLVLEHLTIKELWISEVYFAIEVEEEAEPKFAEGLLQSLSFKQVISGFKVALRNITQTTSAATTSSGFKSVKGIIAQTTSTCQKLSGYKSAQVGVSQTFSAYNRMLGFKSTRGSVTQTASTYQRVVGQKVATANLQQAVSVKQNVSGLKSVSVGVSQTTSYKQYASGRKSTTSSVRQIVAFVQVLPAVHVEGLTWLYASVQNALPYPHIVHTPAPYPLSINKPQSYPFEVEVD